jgi:hypothetical protein
MIIPVGSVEPLSIGPFLTSAGVPVTETQPTVIIYTAGFPQPAVGGSTLTDARGVSTFTPDPSDFYAAGEILIVGVLPGAMQWFHWYQVGTIDVDLGRRVLGGGGTSFLDLGAQVNVPLGQTPESTIWDDAGQAIYLQVSENFAFPILTNNKPCWQSGAGFVTVQYNSPVPAYPWVYQDTNRGIIGVGTAPLGQFFGVNVAGSFPNFTYTVTDTVVATTFTEIPTAAFATAAQAAAILAALASTPIVVRRLIDSAGVLSIAAGDDMQDGDGRSIQFGIPSGFSVNLSGCTPTLDITETTRGMPSPDPMMTVTGQVLTGSYTLNGVTYTRILDFQPTAAQTAELTDWRPQAYSYRVRAVWSDKVVTVVYPAPCTALW